MNETIGAVNTLINAGVRFCHPDTRFTLYKSIALPKLTYGLELCYLNATSSSNLETAAKELLKIPLQFISLNVLSELVDIPSMKDLMNVKRLNIVPQLMRNPLTRSILLNSAISNYSYFWREISVICELYNTTIYEILLLNKKPR